MTPPADKVPYDDLAPTPIEELLAEEDRDNKDGEEGEEGEGSSKGGSGGKKPDVNIPQKKLDEEDLSAYDSESLIEKLKMLVWAPFSAMVPGASAFESEQELKRKLFLGQLGMITNQIDPQDIADPDFINRLEQRNQMRQEKYGIDAMSSAGAAAGIGGAVAALQETPKEQQKKQQKQDTKLQAQQPKEASFDAAIEADDKRPESEQKARAEQQQKLAATQAAPLAPEAEENSFAAEIDKKENIKLQAQNNAKPKDDGLSLGEIVHILDEQKEARAEGIDASESIKGASGFAAIADAFNHVAQQTEYTAPEQKVDFKFADPAPVVATVAPGGRV